MELLLLLLLLLGSSHRRRHRRAQGVMMVCMVRREKKKYVSRAGAEVETEQTARKRRAREKIGQKRAGKSIMHKHFVNAYKHTRKNSTSYKYTLSYHTLPFGPTK